MELKKQKKRRKSLLHALHTLR